MHRHFFHSVHKDRLLLGLWVRRTQMQSRSVNRNPRTFLKWATVTFSSPEMDSGSLVSKCFALRYHFHHMRSTYHIKKKCLCPSELQLHPFVSWRLAEGRASSRGVRVRTAHCQLHQGGQDCPCGDHHQLTQEGMNKIQAVNQVCVCLARGKSGSF